MKKYNFIPVCEPSLKGNEERYVLDALRSTWISSAGEYIARLHQEFPDYLNVNYGTSVNNGTNALHLALLALEIGDGDEVILPSYTMISSAFSICYTGAVPVLVDCLSDSWNINPEEIEKKITPKTKAIMVVHLYGLSCEMDKIMRIAKKHDLKVIEDAAEAHGSEFRGQKCGSFGDISAFSFYSNKNITSGEGGFVVTNDKELHDKCLYYKNLCFPLESARIYEHKDIGYNFRMTNLQAAIAVAQLERINPLIDARRNNASLYNSLLTKISGITLAVEPSGYKNTYWMYSILIEEEFGISRNELMKKLREHKIDSRSFFIPMHQQESLIKYYNKFTNLQIGTHYPVSCEISRKGMYLPSSSHLTSEQIKYICDVILEIKAQSHGRRKLKSY